MQSVKKLYSRSNVSTLQSGVFIRDNASSVNKLLIDTSTLIYISKVVDSFLYAKVPSNVTCSGTATFTYAEQSG